MGKTYPYNFTSFYILSITYYAYNRYFLKECFLLVFLWGGERGGVPSYGALSTLGGGTLHKYLTLILAKQKMGIWRIWMYLEV